jgi:hypothetical protein
VRYHHTDDAPEAIGPYAQAVEVDGWLYTSGQVALDPSSGEMETGSFEAQAPRLMTSAGPIGRISKEGLNSKEGMGGVPRIRGPPIGDGDFTSDAASTARAPRGARTMFRSRDLIQACCNAG